MLELPTCEYREHVNHPGYRIYEDGTIWTDLSNQDETTIEGFYPLKYQVDKDGYLKVTLDKKTRKVHSLVIEAFDGFAPPEMECRHLDGNRKNPRRNNLKWGTKIENRADQDLHGTAAVGEKHPQAVLTDIQIAELIEKNKTGQFSQRELALFYNTTQATISRILSGKSRKNK